MIYAVAVAMTLLAYAVVVYARGQRMSPDGLIYLRGSALPLPFHLRRVVPWCLGHRPVAWLACGLVSLCLAACSVAWLASELGPERQAFAVALFVGLPSFRTMAALPVLVDAPALAFAGVSACLALSGHAWASVAVALAAGACKETAPLFAAAAALSPWPLVGLAAPAVAWLTGRAAPLDHPSQLAPISYARTKQALRLLDMRAMLLPWGACVLAAFDPSAAVVASVALSYAMLFVAADSVRIYQWAALPVCVQAAAVAPAGWLVPLALLHFLNPAQGEV